MSRARHHTTVWVTADDIDQAAEDLKREWPHERRQPWAIDSGRPSTDPAAVEHDHHADPALRNALRHARLTAERDAIASLIPPDPTSDLRTSREALSYERRALADLDTGAGRWAGTKLGDVATVITDTERARQQAVWRSNGPHATRSDVRTARRDITRADVRLDQAHQRLDQLAAPHRTRVQATIGELEAVVRDLEARAHARTDWLAAHPATLRRLEHLDTQLDAIGQALQAERELLDGIDRTPVPTRPPHRSLQQEILDSLPAPQPTRPAIEGPDLGLGL